MEVSPFNPEDPCMVYLPTFTIKIQPKVGKYISPMDPLGKETPIVFRFLLSSLWEKSLPLEKYGISCAVTNFFWTLPARLEKQRIFISNGGPP